MAGVMIGIIVALICVMGILIIHMGMMSLPNVNLYVLMALGLIIIQEIVFVSRPVLELMIFKVYQLALMIDMLIILPNSVNSHV